MTTPNNDSNTLNRIVDDLEANLIVEAGAGTGKTYALVSRLVALVKAGIKMPDIVAITFTEAAAAELSERIRSRLEQLLDDNHPDNVDDLLARDLTCGAQELIGTAIGELDQASIQTIHSFAAQLLRDRPLDANLPPGWATMDEVESSQRFADRWDQWLERTLGKDGATDPELIDSLRYLIKANVGIKRWQDVAKTFGDNSDRLADDSSVTDVDLRALTETAFRQLSELAGDCSNQSDRLFVQLQDAITTVEAVLSVSDDPITAVQALDDGAPVDFKGNVGSAQNWSTPAKDIRDEFRAVGSTLTQAVKTALLIPLLHNLRVEFALNYEAERKADGVATFDDLLSWARDLLRDSEAAREHFRQRYSHILIDEFQDTDPLQAEIAFYLAADRRATVQDVPWHTLPLTPGKLFIVGDDKQSIYHFRGADIGVNQLVKEGCQLSTQVLLENRRSQKPVLDWVNAVFGQQGLMTEAAGVQAHYSHLHFNEALQQEDLGSSVQLFGEQMELGADAVRLRQARHVANLIVSYTGDKDASYRVYDKKCKGIRKANLRDICILIRSRTGLGILTGELEDAGIPYRLEGGSLLFDTQEVQDLLNCLRAVDDPSDAVSAVAALRSPAFACSDAALLQWRDAGGPWNYQSPLLGDQPVGNQTQEQRRQQLIKKQSDSPVRDSLLKILEYHRRRQTSSVALLIAEFIRERRLDELDMADSRPREIWRRRRFLSEQARKLEYDNSITPDSQPLTLHKFIRWSELQQQERARIAEVIVPDSDDDAVRIMTIHAAKGLEFPIVVLLGLAQNPNDDSQPVLFDSSTGSAEVKLGGLQTSGYSRLSEIEKAHADAELVRLAYVGATRARDHLLVSMYRSTTRGNQQSRGVISKIEEVMPELTDLHSNVATNADDQLKLELPSPTGTDPGDYVPVSWKAHRDDLIHHRSLPQSVTATWLAQAASQGGKYLDIEDKDAEPDAEQPWRSGRGGTAFGSAFHAVLHDVTGLASGQLPLAADSDVEDLLSSLDGEIGRLAEFHATVQGVSSSHIEVARLVRRALQHETVAAAFKAPRLWSEIPVAAQIETGRGAVVIEGIIDLLYLDETDKLIIVDYKSDYVVDPADLGAKMSLYQWQGAAYATAIERATGKTVKDVQFLFVRENRAESIPNLRELIDRLPEAIVAS